MELESDFMTSEEHMFIDSSHLRDPRLDEIDMNFQKLTCEKVRPNGHHGQASLTVDQSETKVVYRFKLAIFYSSDTPLNH